MLQTADGDDLVQTYAIMRYLAREGGLAGKSPKEETMCVCGGAHVVHAFGATALLPLTVFLRVLRPLSLPRLSLSRLLPCRLRCCCFLAARTSTPPTHPQV